ncbi:MAG: AAA family ATPase [Pirellulaceae bacterium]
MHKLPAPFFVLATQNPLEQEGTYPFPKPSLTASCCTSKLTIPRAPRSGKSLVASPPGNWVKSNRACRAKKSSRCRSW